MHEKVRLLSSMKVPLKEKEIYELGTQASRITFRSQQVRAINLISLLSHFKKLNIGTEVTIIGAGIAGITAASWALHLGARVSLIEKENREFAIQRDSNFRYIHPWIQEWPYADSKEFVGPFARSKLPILNWRAGNANDVIAQIQRGWDLIKAHFLKAGTLHIDYGQEVTREMVSKFANRDLLIIAAGFGKERLDVAAGRFPYWENDYFGPNAPRGDWVISGTGDGALADIMRASIENFNHGEFLMSLVRCAEDVREKVNIIRKIENDLDRQRQNLKHDPKKKVPVEFAKRLESVYFDCVNSDSFSKIRVIRPKNRRIQVNCAIEDIFTSPALPINKLAAAYLLAHGHFSKVARPKRISIESIKIQKDFYCYKGESDSTETDSEKCNYLILRHGIPKPNKPISNLFSEDTVVSISKNGTDDIHRLRLLYRESLLTMDENQKINKVFRYLPEEAQRLLHLLVFEVTPITIRKLLNLTTDEHESLRELLYSFNLLSSDGKLELGVSRLSQALSDKELSIFNQIKEQVASLEPDNVNIHILRFEGSPEESDLAKSELLDKIQRFRKNGKYQAILELRPKFKRFFEKDDQESRLFLLPLSHAYYRLGNFEEALKVLKKIHSDTTAQCLRALILTKWSSEETPQESSFDRSVAHLKSLLTTEELSNYAKALAYSALGRLYESKAKFEEAGKLFAIASKLWQQEEDIIEAPISKITELVARYQSVNFDTLSLDLCNNYVLQLNNIIKESNSQFVKSFFLLNKISILFDAVEISVEQKRDSLMSEIKHTLDEVSTFLKNSELGTHSPAFLEHSSNYYNLLGNYYEFMLIDSFERDPLIAQDYFKNAKNAFEEALAISSINCHIKNEIMFRYNLGWYNQDSQERQTAFIKAQQIGAHDVLRELNKENQVGFFATNKNIHIWANRYAYS